MQQQYATKLRYRRLDENGDMLLGVGEAGWLSGLDAMRQLISTRLRSIEGEWWEGDPTAIPYLTEVIGAPATERNRQIIDLMVIGRIMDTVGVDSISDITSTFSGRSYSFSCTVHTIYGDTTAEVNV